MTPIEILLKSKMAVNRTEAIKIVKNGRFRVNGIEFSKPYEDIDKGHYIITVIDENNKAIIARCSF
jgi:predicted rRNA methylase YqxC with S4 and FtsJ domains